MKALLKLIVLSPLIVVGLVGLLVAATMFVLTKKGMEI